MACREDLDITQLNAAVACCLAATTNPRPPALEVAGRYEEIYVPDMMAEFFKIDAKDVMTTAQARQALEPYIQPLPFYDEMVLGKKPALAA